MTHDVFISCSPRDQSVTDAICAALETAGIRCWLASRDAGPGIASSQAINEALEASRVILLVSSRTSNKADDVFHEISLAALWGIPIVAYRIDHAKPTGRIGQYVDSQQWLDAARPPHLTRIPDLAATIQLLVKDR